MTIDLQKFCLEDYQGRDYLMRPFRLNGEIVATNGHILVAIPDDGRHVPEAITTGFGESVTKTLAATTDRWISLSTITLPDVEECSICPDPADLEDGEECANCYGTGIKQYQPFRVGETDFNVRYLTLISELPNAEIGISDKIETTPVPFRFDGGHGVLMPMRTR